MLIGHVILIYSRALWSERNAGQKAEQMLEKSCCLHLQACKADAGLSHRALGAKLAYLSTYSPCEKRVSQRRKHDNMDPVSVTASVIAIIQISGSIVSICYDYRNSVREAVKEATRITEEVKGLQDILDRLLKLAELDIAQGSPRLQVLEQLAQPGGILPRCQEHLISLRFKLGPEKKSKSVWSALKWPLTEKDLQKALNNISTAKATISLALITDQT